jgi:hypothetical protein
LPSPRSRSHAALCHRAQGARGPGDLAGLGLGLAGGEAASSKPLCGVAGRGSPAGAWLAVLLAVGGCSLLTAFCLLPITRCLMSDVRCQEGPNDDHLMSEQPQQQAASSKPSSQRGTMYVGNRGGCDLASPGAPCRGRRAGAPVPAGNPGAWGRMGPNGAAPGRTGPHGAWHGARPKSKIKSPEKKEKIGARLAAICCVGVGPTTHWHCHQSTPSLLIYLLLIPPAQ